MTEPAAEVRVELTSAPEGPLLYWNICQGVRPIPIESPRLFFAAQAIALALGAFTFVSAVVIF